MAFWQLRPAGALAAHVEVLWASRREALPHGLEWLLPSGCADLVIPLHDDAVLRAPRGRIERLRGGVFQGASDAALLRATGGRADVVGVHFRPGGAVALFGGAAAEAAGLSVALADFPGPWALWRERLMAEAAPPARLRRLEALLQTRLAGARADPVVAAALARLQASDGQLRIEALRAESGLGATRFIERFRAQTGLTPKRLARVLRFNRALAALAGPNPPSLAELALTTGHADQAHFAHEFRRFAGVPAARYRPASPDQPRHLPERRFLQDTLPRVA